MVFWVVIILLTVFLVIDAINAVRVYSKSKNMPELIIHFILLTILAVFIVNVLFAVLNLDSLIMDIFGWK